SRNPKINDCDGRPAVVDMVFDGLQQWLSEVHKGLRVSQPEVSHKKGSIPDNDIHHPLFVCTVPILVVRDIDDTKDEP
ncbi:hypothetical protein Tco_1158580, partial [Tanacetum coccineum]